MQSLTDKTLLNNVPPTEEVSVCPLCQSEKSELLFTSTDRGFRLPGEFGVTKCANCQLVRLSPRPVVEEIGYYYPESEYYSFQTVGKPIQRTKLVALRDYVRNSVLEEIGYKTVPLTKLQKALQPLFIKFFYKSALYDQGNRFPSFVSGGKALDIGCGNGNFLNLLKQHGWDVKGIDLSKKAAATAKEVFDIDVFVGNTEDAPFTDNSFDYIHMSHSIEHLPNPVTTLSKALKLLKPNGKIYVETPNIDSYTARVCGKYWMPLETPRHLYLFSPATLANLLDQIGFKVLKTQTTFFAPTLAWEDTYIREDLIGEMIENRPTLTFKAAPRAYFHRFWAKIKHIFNSDNAEFVRCWAEK